MKKDILEVGNRWVILVIYVVMYFDFIVFMLYCIFDFYNVFIGISDFNFLYVMFDILYSIMGYVYFCKSVMDDGRCYFCLCLGYLR